MASSFPNGLDSFTDPLGTDRLDDPDHAILHADINDAVERLEAKVGVNDSGVTTSLDYLVRMAMPVGSLTAYVGSTAPDSSWVICNGAAISRTTYSDLFALVGTTFGAGDGTSTFNVPNLKGRVVAGYDSVNGSFNAIGGTGGAETHTLTTAELASHTHAVPSHTHAIDHNHASYTSGSGGAAHTHAVDHNHASATSGAGGVTHTHPVDPPSTTSSSDSHTHTGGSSSHTHPVQFAQGDYFYKAAGTNAAMQGYGLSNYGVSWAGEYVLVASTTSAVNTNNTYASVGHRIHATIGTSGTPSATTTGSDAHTHTTNIASFTSGAESANNHTHAVDLPAFAGSSGSTTASHTHSNDMPAFTGTSGGTSLTTDATGGGSAHNNLQPYMALNWIIKVK